MNIAQKDPERVGRVGLTQAETLAGKPAEELAPASAGKRFGSKVGLSLVEGLMSIIEVLGKLRERRLQAALGPRNASENTIPEAVLELCIQQSLCCW